MAKKTSGKAPRRAQLPARAKRPDRPRVPHIVGVGASAGGLEALGQLLGGVSEASGLAFVVVQHLDPTREGMMPELLQRATRMAVTEVTDRVVVEPGNVYVIPPNKDLSILHGRLHLLEPASPRGLRLPIDNFFRALASDQLAASVGVILSGMGTDGTLGIKAIKEQGGVVLVQDPQSAKFDSMPRSAIETGLADIIAPPEELGERLAAFLRLSPHPRVEEPALEQKSRDALEKIVIVLRARTNHDFSQYKSSTLYRRIERRMAIHQISKIATYVRFLQENPSEQDLLYGELLIGVTSFFRDPPAWEALCEQVLPRLFAERPKGGQLRAWTVGCSTGEEAYTLAMVFVEALERTRPKAGFSLQIFATDLDRRAIERTRRGLYPANIAADVSPERLRRFFVPEADGTYRVAKEIRGMVTPAHHDIISDPPFTKLDLVVCRNLLIYLEPELQGRLLPLLHYSLNPGGVLFLGSSETVRSSSDLFTPLDPRLRLYRRRESLSRPEMLNFPPTHSTARSVSPPRAGTGKPTPNLQAVVDDLILRHFGPAGALVNEQGDILYISGRTSRYLEAPAGKVNWNVFAMARDGLRYGLTSAVQQAVRQKRVVTVHGLKVGTNGETRGIDLTVRPVQEPAGLRGLFLVMFSDSAIAAPAKGDSRKAGRVVHKDQLSELQAEVKQLHEELRTTRDEMQTSQEELRSANEELQSMNEELQSTNEELTTSKEETQSMNEELQTVNSELQTKVDELSRANNDLQNLLNSTQIATLFLDRAMRVRRFTVQATRIIKLISSDVGRPVTDIASDVIYKGLAEDVQEVLRTLAPSEKEIGTLDGRWFVARVMPYRTVDDVIDGVVITFVDITASKVLEGELRGTRERFGALIENLHNTGVSILDETGQTVPREEALVRITKAKATDLGAWKMVPTATVAEREASE